MSKIGKKLIEIPNDVQVNINKTQIAVNGPKGNLQVVLRGNVKAQILDNKLKVIFDKNEKRGRSYGGLMRSLIANAVIGVSKGWTKTLKLVGVGYRASVAGCELILTVGFTHQVKIKIPENISVYVKENKITIDGIDKQAVGQLAAQIRRARPPEPYKGKGIRYIDEKVRRKAGKTAKTVGLGAK